MQVELDLAFLLNFSRKLVFIKNDVEMLFFLKTGFKIGVRIIHGCALYMGKYGIYFYELYKNLLPHITSYSVSYLDSYLIIFAMHICATSFNF